MAQYPKDHEQLAKFLNSTTSESDGEALKLIRMRSAIGIHTPNTPPNTPADWPG